MSHRLKGLPSVRCYRISPHVFIEFFDEDAVMLVADQDMMVTVNHSAAQLFALAAMHSAGRALQRSDWVDFLLHYFQLKRANAERQVRAILGFAVRHGLVEKCSAEKTLNKESRFATQRSENRHGHVPGCQPGAGPAYRG